MCADLLKTAAASACDCRREFISLAEVNNTVLLQCVASSSPPLLPLHTCKALMSRLKRSSSSSSSGAQALQLLQATVACQAACAHLHSASLAMAFLPSAAASAAPSSSTAAALGTSAAFSSWASLRSCWFSFNSGVFLLLLPLLLPLFCRCCC
jgi:hypothetical protein